jgi:hypothetical protein
LRTWRLFLPRDDQPLARAGRHRCLVDFPKIDGSLNRWGSWGLDFTLWKGGHDQVQFIAPAPDQRDRSDLIRQIGQMKGEGPAPSAHWQDEPLALAWDRLGGPGHRPVLLGVMGVAVKGVGEAQVFACLDVGEELVADQLDRLAMQAILPTFGFPLQIVTIWPGRPLISCILMPLEAVPPDPRGFQLCGFEAC